MLRWISEAFTQIAAADHCSEALKAEVQLTVENVKGASSRRSMCCYCWQAQECAPFKESAVADNGHMLIVKDQDCA